MRELVHNAPDLIEQLGGVRYNWPVIVSGVVPTYSFTAAHECARSPVYRTCALLSLFWGKYGAPQRPARPGAGGCR